MDFVNNIGDTEIIYNSCGTGPDVNIENWTGVVEVIGDNDNGSPSLSGDNGFEVGRINNIEPRDVVVMQSIIITMM